MSEPVWTSSFMEQYALEWLKHDVLLPTFKRTGESNYRVKELKSIARRKVNENLGIEKHRPWQQTFLNKYKNMLSKLVVSVQATTVEEVLRVAPPWVQQFEQTFHILDKVVNERNRNLARMREECIDKTSILSAVLRAMWWALRRGEGDPGGRGGGAGAGSGTGGGRNVFGRAVAIAAKRCQRPPFLVNNAWKETRGVALQKLRLLQSMGDKLSAGSPAALSPLDWLAVDMVLLYDTGERLLNEESFSEYAVLSTLVALFSLVQVYGLAEPAPEPRDHLERAWRAATQRYLDSGHSSSLVVVQRRWYEAVRLARAQLAECGRGGRAPTVLAKRLALRYPQLMTRPLPAWDAMVAAGAVYTDHPDTRITAQPSADAPCLPPALSTDELADILNEHNGGELDDDDIILIEKEIETIDLDVLDSKEEMKQTPLNKMDSECLKKELLENRKKICATLDKELDVQLTTITKREHHDHDYVGGSDNNINNIQSTRIDLTVSDTEESKQIKDIQSLRTEIDLDVLERFKIECDSDVTLQAVAKPTSELEQANKEDGEIDKSENENASGREYASLSLLQQMDPTSIETKIIFSDEDSESNDTVLVINTEVHDDIQKTDQQANETQDARDVGQIKVERENEKQIVTVSTTVNRDIGQENSVINLDTDSENEIINDIDKHVSCSSNHEDVEPSPPKRKKIGPKSFIEKYENSSDKSSPDKPVSKKKRIGPKSFMHSLKQKECIKSRSSIDDNSSAKKSDKSVLIFEDEIANEVNAKSATIVNTLPVKHEKEYDDACVEASRSAVIHKPTSQNVARITYTEDESSEEEEPNLVIDEDNDNSLIKKRSDKTNNVEEQVNISSRLNFEQDGNDSINSDESNVIIKEKKNKTAETAMNNPITRRIGPKSKTRTNKPTESQQEKFPIQCRDRFSFESNNTEVELADAKPIIPMDIDVPEANDEITVNIDSSKRKQNYTTDLVVKVEKSVNKTENDPLGGGSKEESRSNIDAKILLPAAVQLNRIDELNVWQQHAKDGSVDLSRVNLPACGPTGLKSGARPSRVPTHPAKRFERRSYRKKDLKTNPDFDVTKRELSSNFVAKNAYKMASLCTPLTVDVERLPFELIKGYLQSEPSEASASASASARAGGGAGRMRTRARVSLADIEEVRRVNSALLTAQVRPTRAPASTEIAEPGSGSDDSDSLLEMLVAVPARRPALDTADTADPHPARPEPAPLLDSGVENTLTPQQLEEVLNKLKTAPPRVWSHGARGRYCCVARRHIAYNSARERFAVKAGKLFHVKDVHAAAGAAHAQMTCSCCCAGALRAGGGAGRGEGGAGLHASLRALDLALRRLVNNQRQQQPPDVAETKDEADKRRPPEQSQTPTKEEKKKEYDKKRGLTRKEQERRRKEQEATKRLKQAQSEQQNIEYDDWLQQRNSCAKYFSLNPSGNIINKKMPFKVTVRPQMSRQTKNTVKANLWLPDRGPDTAVSSTSKDAKYKPVATNNEYTVGATRDDQDRVSSTAEDNITTTAPGVQKTNAHDDIINLEHSYIKPQPVAIRAQPQEAARNFRILAGPIPGITITPIVGQSQPATPHVPDPSVNQIQAIPVTDQSNASVDRDKNDKSVPIITKVVSMNKSSSKNTVSKFTKISCKSDGDRICTITASDKDSDSKSHGNVDQKAVKPLPSVIITKQLPRFVLDNNPNLSTSANRPVSQLFLQPVDQQVEQPAPKILIQPLQPQISCQNANFFIQPMELQAPNLNQTTLIQTDQSQNIVITPLVQPPWIKSAQSTNSNDQTSLNSLLTTNSYPPHLSEAVSQPEIVSLIAAAKQNPGVVYERVLHSPVLGRELSVMCEAKCTGDPSQPVQTFMVLAPKQPPAPATHPPQVLNPQQQERRPWRVSDDGADTISSPPTPLQWSSSSSATDTDAHSEPEVVELSDEDAPGQDDSTRIEVSNVRSLLRSAQEPANNTAPLKTAAQELHKLIAIAPKAFKCEDLSTAPPIHVTELLRQIEETRTPPSEIQLLCVNSSAPLLKLYNCYILVTPRPTAPPNTCPPSYWTLKPRLQLNRVIFEKQDAPQSSDAVKTPAETSPGSNPGRLKVKAFAKLPDTGNALTAEGCPGVPQMLAVDELFVDDKFFKRVSHSPPVYAQVVTAVSDCMFARRLLLEQVPLFVLDPRAEGGGGRAARVSVRFIPGSDNPHSVATTTLSLHCALYPHAVRHLVQLLNESYPAGSVRFVCDVT